MSYDRFVRYRGDTEVTADIIAPGPGPVELRVGREYLGEVQVQSVTPDPSEVSVRGDEVVYVYSAVAVLVLFHLAGKRTLAQITTFDLVLLLIISEGTQQALLGDGW